MADNTHELDCWKCGHALSADDRVKQMKVECPNCETLREYRPRGNNED